MNWSKGNWGIMVYLWHSINLVPAFSFITVASDSIVDPLTGCKGWDGRVVARCLELTVFGCVVNIMWPNTKFKKQYSSPLVGPLYSRKRKVWYRP